MLQGKVSVKNLSAWLTIMEYKGDSAKSGVAAFASFLSAGSASSLGFLNLLAVGINPRWRAGGFHQVVNK